MLAATMQSEVWMLIQKKCAARAKLLLFFFLIRPIVVFHRSPALPSFEQTINIILSFAFSPGQIFIYGFLVCWNDISLGQISLLESIRLLGHAKFIEIFFRAKC